MKIRAALCSILLLLSSTYACNTQTPLKEFEDFLYCDDIFEEEMHGDKPKKGIFGRELSIILAEVACIIWGLKKRSWSSLAAFFAIEVLERRLKKTEQHLVAIDDVHNLICGAEELKI